jgi:hypothetical protein
MIRKRSTRSAELALADEVMRDPDYGALPDRVRSALKKHVRGLWGEKETAFMLDRKFGSDDGHVLIHDLRLSDGQGGFAQFDHVLLSRLSRTAAIFESKNYAGNISKNVHGEWMVWYRGQHRPQNIPNPVAQAQRQREVLAAWLKRKGHIKAFERIGVFVSVPATNDIDRSKIGNDEPIYKCDNLVAGWTPFGHTGTLSRLFSTGVSGPQMLAIADQLIADHVEEQDIYVRLGIHPGPDGNLAEVDTSQAEDPGPEPIVDEPTEPAVEPVKAASEPAPPAAEAAIAEKAPLSPGPRKAGAQIEVCAGIVERTLPDGRIAFRAAKDDHIGREALTALCKGRAVWNPMFANWVCLPEIATEIRAGLPSAVQLAQLP